MNHLMLTGHVDASAQGLGIWFLLEKMGYQCWWPVKAPTEVIFFFKALAICCAVHLTIQFWHVTWLLITTKSTTTFDIFMMLRAQPNYNPILMSAINILLKHKLDLWVFYLPGPKIFITDALSQYKMIS